MKDTPAFPVQEAYSMSTERGMTLRDYFAAKAMNGIMMYSVEWHATHKPPDATSLAIFEDMAQDSYFIADAMMKARDK